MPPCPARLILPFAAVLLCTAAGAVATAHPGGAPRPLAPTAQLASNGGVEASPPAGSGGGVEAPPEMSPPIEAAERIEAAPVEPESAPPPVSAEVVIPPAGPVPQEGAEVAPTPVPETSDPAASPPLDPPTTEQALDASGEPLVPVEILSLPVVAAEDSAPLIDIAPKELDAPPLEEIASSEVAQTEDDGEVTIPVPPEDIDEDEDDDEDGAQETQPGGGVRTPASGPVLALTGRRLFPPLAAGVMLVLVGCTLRMATAPSVPSQPRA